MHLIPASIITGILAYYGYKKKSLNFSGALSAIPIGLSICLNQYAFVTFTLLVFFLTSSKLTKVSFTFKINYFINFSISSLSLKSKKA
jgi:uncharacterized membrane protein